MLTTQQLIVGIFRTHTQAEHAINELRQVGFDNRHLRFTKHGFSIDKILKNYINSCAGQQPLPNSIYDDLVNIGMPLAEAQRYQREFEAGYSIVAVLNSAVPLIATSILTRNGSRITNQHFVQPINYNQNTDQSAPTFIIFLKCLLKRALSTIKHFLRSNQPVDVQATAKYTYAELNSLKERSTPSTDYGQCAKEQKPSTMDINANTNVYIAPSSDYDNIGATHKISRELMREKISKGLINA